MLAYACESFAAKQSIRPRERREMLTASDTFETWCEASCSLLFSFAVVSSSIYIDGLRFMRFEIESDLVRFTQIWSDAAAHSRASAE